MKVSFEKIHKEALSSIKVVVLDREEGQRPLHFHPEYELTLITKGFGKRFVGDHISTFTKNDLVLIGENLPHCWIHSTKLDIVSIQFNRSIFGDNFLNLPELNEIKTLLDDSNRGLFFENAKSDMISRIRKLSNLSNFDRISELLIILHELGSKVHKTSLSSKHFNTENFTKTKHRIDKVFNYIYQNINGELKVEVAAGILNMTTSAFCHYFKKCTEKTFSEFVNEIRIGYASKLLIETDNNVSQIAFESGYNSLSNFNQRFKQIKGMSPKSFREKYHSDAYKESKN
ncbi:AraC family transcriptional regulator [Marinifilum caeruleilacunae]|uniref:AraC family transcriptional regulator n=1 Tax=Marinifilum caeruleilacunae TaxID=2499076 RepID=A0ABX1WQW2_9BACT|nr:AraC family transcriptional regulator [Marinifilum caeruleilacunae]NOU58372.1 AraC family transcriptional regulator [Marinifilum caeruleilacunae]